MQTTRSFGQPPACFFNSSNNVLVVLSSFDNFSVIARLLLEGEGVEFRLAALQRFHDFTRKGNIRKRRKKIDAEN